MTSEIRTPLMIGAAGTRELGRRIRDGIDVRLLWHPQTDRVSVAVSDRRADSAFEFEVDPADALAAFHHPYAYANHDRGAHALAA
jgi:hypothetical protein